MRITFDPNGGDLGQGNRILATDLTTVVPHIANILQAIYDMDKSQNYKYGFEVILIDSHRIRSAMNYIILPKNVHWYEVNGLRVFDIKGASGGVVALACYLVTHG